MNRLRVFSITGDTNVLNRNAITISYKKIIAKLKNDLFAGLLEKENILGEDESPERA